MDRAHLARAELRILSRVASVWVRPAFTLERRRLARGVQPRLIAADIIALNSGSAQRFFNAAAARAVTSGLFGPLVFSRSGCALQYARIRRAFSRLRGLVHHALIRDLVSSLIISGRISRGGPMGSCRLRGRYRSAEAAAMPTTP